MAKSFQDIMAEARKEIPEVTPQQVNELLKNNGKSPVMLDVRESDEWRQGHLEGALPLPRGFLEIKVESDDSGQEHADHRLLRRRRALAVGRQGHERDGLSERHVHGRRLRRLEERRLQVGAGFSVHAGAVDSLQPPFSPAGSRRRRSGEAAASQSADGRRRRSRFAVGLLSGGGRSRARSASSTTTSSIFPTCSGKFSTPTTASACRKSSRRRKPSKRSIPTSKSIPYQAKLTSENIMEIIKDYDLVVDGCDNFPTRYLVNDACVLTGKPNVHGSIFQFEGQATVFYPGKGPCYRCLYPEPPPAEMAPSCAEAGVLGVLPGLIGVIEALEAMKLILGKGDSLVGRLLHFNTLTMEINTLKLRRDPNCPMCGDNPTIQELIDYEEFCSLAPLERRLVCEFIGAAAVDSRRFFLA